MAQKQISDLAFASGIAKDDEFVLRKVSDGTDYRITREESRSDLAANQGSALVGDSSGATVHDLLPIHLQFSTYAALRSYAYIGADIVQVTGDGIAGLFKADPSDTTTADNGGTVIVAADGMRWKRQYSIPTSGMFESDIQRLKTAIPGGTVIVDTPCTLIGTLSSDYTAVFTANGSITVATGTSANLYADIIAPSRQLFTINGTLDCSQMQGLANPYWWGGADLGEAVNRAFTSLKRELRLPWLDPNTGALSVISTPIQMINNAHLVQDSKYWPIHLQTGNTNPAIQFISVLNCTLDLRLKGAATQTPAFAIMLARNTSSGECGYNSFDVIIDGQFNFGVVYSIASELDDWGESQLLYQGTGDGTYPYGATFVTSNHEFLNVSTYAAVGAGSNSGVRYNGKVIQYDITDGSGRLLWMRDLCENIEFTPLYAHYNGADHAFLLESNNYSMTNVRIGIRARLETQAGNPATNSVKLMYITDSNNGQGVNGLILDGEYFLGNGPNAVPPTPIVVAGTAFLHRLKIPTSFFFGINQIPTTLVDNVAAKPLIGHDIQNSQGCAINVNSTQVQDSTIHISGPINNQATSSPWLRSSILSSNVTSFGP